ncbi:ras-related protein Rab-38-like [Dendronephthya gigantea]|uniref:ras-related protein Rab-38-like n=1 Tax=Dendronephthya gigantea TaxID=151771 RepID=UPI00106C1EB8|nr:ras-related protein Rab-38-like [Dendronephthya gigantea]
MAKAYRLMATETTKSKKNQSTEERNEFEMTTFKTNCETELEKWYGCKKLHFKVICVGDCSGAFSKAVYIKDYVLKPVTTKDYYSPVIGVDFDMKKLHDTSGNEIHLQIWNIMECDRQQDPGSTMCKVYYRFTSGVIVFWGANCSSMKSAIKWKHHVSCSAYPETDIPFVLIVDNAYKTPPKWIGQGLVMESTEEMDRFCEEHGFFAWFELCERSAGENSVLGKAMVTLINEICSGNRTSAV